MQRSRRRKLLRDAQRNPVYLQALRGRDHLRHLAYQGVNREQRRIFKLDAYTKLREVLR